MEDIYTVKTYKDAIVIKLKDSVEWKVPKNQNIWLDIVKNISDTLREKNEVVILDLREIDFIDSYVISILVQISFINPDVKNTILASDNQVKSVLKLVGIEDIYNIFSSLEEYDIYNEKKDL